ncbi:hypothetical protein LUZ60_006137 [Juncus effusus]|nr:hypothetical protein LUZ60_006137 [Juncus effusus]
MCLEIEKLFGLPSRQTRELKTQLRCTIGRIALLRRKHQVQCAMERDDIAHLLLQTETHRAFRRAEQVVKEQKMLDIYNLVEMDCNRIIGKALLFDQQMDCPDELFEAVSGLIYAAPRCGDLPELRKVRHIFTDKYGKDFIMKCGFDPQVIEMFSRKVSIESMKSVTMQIAYEQGIKLDIAELVLPYNAEENLNVEVRNEIINKSSSDKIHPVKLINMEKEEEERRGLLHDNNSDENMKNVDDKLKRKTTLSFGKRVGVSVRTRRSGNG